jgi:hypothetical protein
LKPTFRSKSNRRGLSNYFNPSKETRKNEHEIRGIDQAAFYGWVIPQFPILEGSL